MAKPRRGRVYQRTQGRGKPWSFAVDVSRPGATRREQLKKGGFRTKIDAQEALTEVLASVQHGDGARFSPGRATTVGAYLEGWITARKAAGLKPSTIADYRNMLTKHAISRVGEIKLQDLTAADLDQIYGAMTDDGLSARTVRYLHTVMKKALGDAERKDLVLVNVARKATPPSASAARAPEAEVWSPAEVRQFLDHVEASVDRVPYRGTADHLPLFRFVAMTGARRGEALGLHWDDVDLDDGAVVIRRSRTAVDHESVEGTPKSGRSRRIDLDPGTVAVLRSWRTEQKRAQLLMGAGWQNEHGHVFTMRDGTPWAPDAISRAFSRLVESSGLRRIRLHDLRHSHATALFSAGFNPRMAADRLGHADPGFTLARYGHALPGQQAEAAAAIGRAVDG